MIRLVLFILAIFLVGCSSSPQKSTVYSSGKNKSTYITSNTKSATNSWGIREKLYSQYQQWRGVRYVYGGLSIQGIDCSGLVYVTYRDRLGVKMPRSTKQLAKEGREIKYRQLRAGDLVFFRTGREQKHVGIYIEDGKFLHASTRKGVVISRLSDDYWKNNYWQSRRMNIRG